VLRVFWAIRPIHACSRKCRQGLGRKRTAVQRHKQTIVHPLRRHQSLCNWIALVDNSIPSHRTKSISRVLSLVGQPNPPSPQCGALASTLFSQSRWSELACEDYDLAPHLCSPSLNSLTVDVETTPNGIFDLGSLAGSGSISRTPTMDDVIDSKRRSVAIALLHNPFLQTYSFSILELIPFALPASTLAYISRATSTLCWTDSGTDS
jgi:hypothetical protein